jgi:hypothetical protein
MAVLCEAISVIIKVSSIDQFYKGGREEFKKHIPNSTMCSDGELVRIGFMSPSEVREYIDELIENGLQFVPEELSVETAKGVFSFLEEIREEDDIIVVDQQKGAMIPCGWIEFAHLSIDEEDNKIAACWLFEGERMGYGIHMPAEGFEISTPDGWSFEGSLSHQFTFIENDADNTKQ